VSFPGPVVHPRVYDRYKILVCMALSKLLPQIPWTNQFKFNIYTKKICPWKPCSTSVNPRCPVGEPLFYVTDMRYVNVACEAGGAGLAD
jgi:hypothetical protein